LLLATASTSRTPSGRALDAWAAAIERVIFAVTDWSPERRFIEPFEREFGVAP